jgi:peptidyl-prolyl cis-trans isomerase C
MRYPWIRMILVTFILFTPIFGMAENETVLLRHGEVNVTEADYQAELATIPEQYRAGIEASGERIHQLLDKIFVHRVLAQEARELGLDQDPLLQKQVELAVENVLGRARLQHLREQALAADPDFEALARERYETDPEKYQQPERVKVSHILIKTEGRSEQEAQQLAEEIRELVLKGKQPFAELALEYSEDTSVQQNQGNLGFISKGNTVRPFEEAAFSLQKPGEISPVVKSEFGFHVLRLEERQPAQQQPFAKVKDRLMREARETYLKNVVQTHLTQIRTAEGIEMNTEALQALKKELPRPMPVRGKD